MLEVIWGKGYMAPGRAGNVKKMLEGIPTAGKNILDIGSGLGGPAIDMVIKHRAQVTGIDLEHQLVEHAKQLAKENGILIGCEFQHVQPGKLDFDDNSFDIVTSSGALTQTENKFDLLQEIYRVLKPGGWLSAYDWMKIDGDYSSDMLYWFKTEGLTYAMVTQNEQNKTLLKAGFVSIASQDATDWYQTKAQLEYEQIRGKLYPQLVNELGRDETDEFVENWRALTTVLNQKEMRTVYTRAQKPHFN